MTEKDIKFIDTRKKLTEISTGEKILLNITRTSLKHWKYIICFLFGFILSALIFK